MATPSDINELRRRLASLGERLGGVHGGQARAGGAAHVRVGNEHELRERYDSLRARLEAFERNHTTAGRSCARKELERDYESLLGSFERWVKQQDGEFGSR